MTDTSQLNVRLPKLSHDQLNQIREQYGLTQVQVIIIALDRLHEDLRHKRITLADKTE